MTRISKEIGHVDLSSSINHFLVFLYYQPTHMCKKEASFGIVGILVSFRKFMVCSVVTSPVKDGTLAGSAVGNHQDQPHDPVSRITTMRPKAMCSSCDTQASINVGAE